MKRFVYFAACVLSLFVVSAQAQTVTQLTMTSDPGDYLGQAESYAYDAADVWQVFQFGVNLQINVHPANYATWWTFIIMPPAGQALSSTTYTTHRFSDGAFAGLDLSGTGRGCNTSTGTLTIRHLTYKPGGELSSLWLTFEQHCEGQPPAMYGELLYNVPQTVPIERHTWGQIKATYR